MQMLLTLALCPFVNNSVDVYLMSSSHKQLVPHFYHDKNEIWLPLSHIAKPHNLVLVVSFGWK